MTPCFNFHLQIRVSLGYLIGRWGLPIPRKIPMYMVGGPTFGLLGFVRLFHRLPHSVALCLVFAVEHVLDSSRPAFLALVHTYVWTRRWHRVMVVVCTGAKA